MKAKTVTLYSRNSESRSWIRLRGMSYSREPEPTNNSLWSAGQGCGDGDPDGGEADLLLQELWWGAGQGEQQDQEHHPKTFLIPIRFSNNTEFCTAHLKSTVTRNKGTNIVLKIYKHHKTFGFEDFAFLKILKISYPNQPKILSGYKSAKDSFRIRISITHLL